MCEHRTALREYVGRKSVSENENKTDFAKHRAHFRVTAEQKKFIKDNADKLHCSESRFCAMMTEEMLPFIESKLFDDETHSEAHFYKAGDFCEDLFVRFDEETFLMLQYLKEQLHFYSYGEVFRVVVDFFMAYFDENPDSEDDPAQAMQACIRTIRQQCRKRYARSTVGTAGVGAGGTIVPPLLRRVRATAACLSPNARIYLQTLFA